MIYDTLDRLEEYADIVPFVKEDSNYTENKKKHSYSTKSKKVKYENEE